MATTINEAGYKVNDIVYVMWGYEQTNVNFYKVVKVTAKSISIIGIKSHAIDGEIFGVEYVTPDPENLRKYDPFNKKQRDKQPMKVMTNGRTGVYLGNYDKLEKYETKPIKQTSY